MTYLSSSEGITAVTIDLSAGRPLTTSSTQPSSTRPDTASQQLADAAGFEVQLPGDPGYEAARLAWNRAVDQRPAAVAVPRSAHDVSRLVRLASEHGLRVAPQSTGHNAGPLAQRGLDDVVVAKMSALNEVSIDPVRRIARVGGGAIWDPAVTAAATHGLAALHGSSPDVGIVGYSLGGGLGWYGRALGLAANHVTAAEIVIGDGTIVRTDAEHDPELLWAMRGRRRQLRRGHRAGVLAVRHPHGVRRHDDLRHQSRRRRCCGAGRGGPPRRRRR